MNRIHPRVARIGAGMALALAAATAGAVGTRTFEIDDGKDFEGGDVKGVAVDSTGRVRAGFNFGSTKVPDVTAIWSVLALEDGSLLLGTGNEGKLVSVRGANVKVVAETKALVVTSLVKAWGGSVVLGTMPDGKVMKWAGGKLSTVARLKDAEHVWQVAFDPKTKAVFAATGPKGKLYRITRQGNAQVYFDADEEQLMSVAVAPDGVVYAGASNKAKLYKITGPGRATVLHDFGKTEVRSLVIGAKGEVYAVANEISAGSYAPMPTRGQKTAATPQPPPPKTTGKGSLYRIDPDGSPDRLLKNEKEHFVGLAVGDDGRPYVGTGVEGRVYTVDEIHNSVLVADTEERMVSALAVRGKHRYIASSDPAVLHAIRGVGGPDAVWTSKVLDAGIRARFGKMTWTADGELELSTRTGNTKEPDDTWSGWSRPMRAPGLVASPAAQFLQVRARWSRDPKAVLHEVTIPFLTDNLRAVLKTVKVGGKRSPAAGIAQSGGPITAKPDTKVKLEWKVDNPDKDTLRYRLQYRLVGTTTWFDLLKPHERVTAESYSWETKDLPEGVYRVRVIASDELSNPPDRVKQHELESPKVIVDNTAPTIENLRVQGRHIRGVVLDGVGPITRLEISVTGTDEWYPFYPSDGIFDEQREEFDVDVSKVAPKGKAMLVVRAFDRGNNSVLRHVTLR